MYDGIQRPLEEMVKECGSNITRGIKVPALSRTKKWTFVPTVKAGDEVEAGMEILRDLYKDLPTI